MLRINKKLREARFFLGKMEERAHMAFGNHEEFDFYLSAFLSAGRSVDYRLRKEQDVTYPTFYKTWESNLHPKEQRIIKFMVDDRNLEVHASGSNRVEKERHIPVSNLYQDKSGKVIISAPPGTSPSEIIKPIFYFTIDGQQESVIEVCRRYIDILERLLEDYRHSQGLA